MQVADSTDKASYEAPNEKTNVCSFYEHFNRFPEQYATHEEIIKYNYFNHLGL